MADQFEQSQSPAIGRPFLAFVSNLPQGLVQNDVIKIFERNNICVRNVRMVKDRETDQFKGYCYVEFNSQKDLIEVTKLGGRIQLEGSQTFLCIDVDTSKK